MKIPHMPETPEEARRLGEGLFMQAKGAIIGRIREYKASGEGRILGAAVRFARSARKPEDLERGINEAIDAITDENAAAASSDEGDEGET